MTYIIPVLDWYTSTLRSPFLFKGANCEVSASSREAFLAYLLHHQQPRGFGCDEWDIARPTFPMRRLLYRV